MAKRITSRVRQARLDMAARLGRTVSIREVSRETGIAVSTLRRLEDDKAEGVDFATLTRLAEFYGVARIDDLFQMADEDRRTARVAGCPQLTTRAALV
jgi:DNA-binding Xre family transcriptional regulator